MFVAKQFDIIMGVDTHIILIPTPGGPVPTPIPHPFVGIVFDPPEFVPIIGATILVNGIPRGQAGTKVKNAVPHIPIGGPFQKPPANEGEIQMGSITILADFQPCSFSGLPAYTCQDVGKTAPTRKKRKSSSKTKGLVLPTSILLAIPKGGINGVGGVGSIPTESKEEDDKTKKAKKNKQLQAKFKHAEDFGVSGNYSKANAAKFESAITQHINSSGTQIIQGTYRGETVTHCLNPSTGLNVILKPSGEFLSGWRLGADQLANVLRSGSLT